VHLHGAQPCPRIPIDRATGPGRVIAAVTALAPEDAGYIHELRCESRVRSVVHRDVVPDNVPLSRAGAVKAWARAVGTSNLYQTSMLEVFEQAILAREAARTSKQPRFLSPAAGCAAAGAGRDRRARASREEQEP
jgi:hypothetical protein